MNNKMFVLRNLKKNFSKISKNYFSSKYESPKNSRFRQMLECTGILVKKSPSRNRPETFVGDLQEILKLAPNNINAFFFSWSIACRAATALLCLLLL